MPPRFQCALARALVQAAVWSRAAKLAAGTAPLDRFLVSEPRSSVAAMGVPGAGPYHGPESAHRNTKASWNNRVRDERMVRTNANSLALASTCAAAHWPWRASAPGQARLN